jgi:hypothetical protein
MSLSWPAFIGLGALRFDFCYKSVKSSTSWLSWIFITTRTLPLLGVNFTEFDRKLLITYKYLYLSPQILLRRFICSDFSTSAQSCTYFEFAWPLNMFKALNTTKGKSKYSSLRVKAPLSIFA